MILRSLSSQQDRVRFLAADFLGCLLQECPTQLAPLQPYLRELLQPVFMAESQTKGEAEHHKAVAAAQQILDRYQAVPQQPAHAARQFFDASREHVHVVPGGISVVAHHRSGSISSRSFTLLSSDGSGQRASSNGHSLTAPIAHAASATLHVNVNAVAASPPPPPPQRALRYSQSMPTNQLNAHRPLPPPPGGFTISPGMHSSVPQQSLPPPPPPPPPPPGYVPIASAPGQFVYAQVPLHAAHVSWPRIPQEVSLPAAAYAPQPHAIAHAAAHASLPRAPSAQTPPAHAPVPRSPLLHASPPRPSAPDAVRRGAAEPQHQEHSSAGSGGPAGLGNMHGSGSAHNSLRDTGHMSVAAIGNTSDIGDTLTLGPEATQASQNTTVAAFRSACPPVAGELPRERLQREIEAMATHRHPVPFDSRYVFVNEFKKGGQAVVAFARELHCSNQQFAIKCALAVCVCALCTHMACGENSCFVVRAHAA